MNQNLSLLTLWLLTAIRLLAATPEQVNSALLNSLAQQSVPAESILGIDDNGVPRVCGFGIQNTASIVSVGTNSTSSLLPAGVRSWEFIPNVIRNDGLEWFRLEVDVNGPATSVRWGFPQNYSFISESGNTNINLRDDGLNGDRVAGDYIFTSEKYWYNTNIGMPSAYPDAPAGAYQDSYGDLSVNGEYFLIKPCIAVLNTNVPAVETVMLASNIQVSAHLINLVTTNRELQRVLRIGGSLTPLIQRIYSVLPDAFDFLPFFSTDHIEYSNRLTSANFVLGKYMPVSRNFTGTGTSIFDNTAAFGSSGRLKGIPMMDIMERGINNSKNAAHEISHHWAAELSTSLFITSGDGHYSRDCFINSILGGQYKAVTNTGPGGGYIKRCFYDDFTNATPLDKYVMGLISTSAVPPLLVSSNTLNISCDGVITNLRAPVTISNIVAVHGVRTPSPATAQKDFRLGFVAASHNRLLTITEMTYYDLLAAHFTKPLATNHPAPNITFGWTPITKFFGEGTTWNSDVLGLIRPTITNTLWLTNGFRVDGTGYPGRNYRLLATTNLVSWTQITNKVATSNGTFSLNDNSQPRQSRRYYRVVTP